MGYFCSVKDLNAIYLDLNLFSISFIFLYVHDHSHLHLDHHKTTKGYLIYKLRYITHLQLENYAWVSSRSYFGLINCSVDPKAGYIMELMTQERMATIVIRVDIGASE